MLRDRILDFRVTRDRLLLPGCRVQVHIVAATVPQQNAPSLLKLAES